MKKIIGLSILMLTLAFNHATADEDLSLFNQAMDRMLNSSYDGWSFNQTTKGKKNIKVEHFDSSKPEDHKWTLITLNGKEPTKKEIKKYLKQKRKEVTRQKNKDGEDVRGNDFLEEIIKPGSVSFIENKNGQNIYQFQPEIEANGINMEGHVFGEITVDVNTPQITQLRLYIKEAFSVKIAKIKEFETIMKFAVVDANNPTTSPVFINSIQSKAKGKAALFFSFDRKNLVTYSDYVAVPLTASP